MQQKTAAAIKKIANQAAGNALRKLAGAPWEMANSDNLKPSDAHYMWSDANRLRIATENARNDKQLDPFFWLRYANPANIIGPGAAARRAALNRQERLRNTIVAGHNVTRIDPDEDFVDADYYKTMKNAPELELPEDLVRAKHKYYDAIERVKANEFIKALKKI